MKSTDLVISIEAVEILLAQWLGSSVSCSKMTRLDGGMLNTVFRLEFNQAPHTAVVKMSTENDVTFASEKKRLDYLRDVGALRCPEVFVVGTTDEDIPYSFLLMEDLHGVNLGTAQLLPDDRSLLEFQLAEALLHLHSHRRDTFGQIDEDPGATRWVDIVIPRLIDMRSEMEGTLHPLVLSDIDIAIDAAPEVLASQGEPTLIHGDLWAGNMIVAQSDSSWTISGFIDPGAQYADVEHELAYLQAFDTVGQAFLDAYTAHTPMRPGFELRRLFYWLNTHMVHVWLFGDQEHHEKTASVASEIARRYR
jgi:fructosamine-3-kinase